MEQLIKDHWPAVTVAFGWLIREAHQFGPGICDWIKGAWPYVSTHGGVFGIARTFFVGQKTVENQTPKT